MTTYSNPGPAGGASSTNTGASFAGAGTGNTLTVSAEAVYAGEFAVKMVMGNPAGPTNPTAASYLEFFADGVTGGAGTTFGTPSDLTSGMTVWFQPAAGFKTASGGLSTVRQWYGGTSTTTGSIYGRLQAADAVSGLTSSGSVIAHTGTWFGNSDQVVFTSVGTATNIVAGTTYYVVSKGTNQFSVAATLGGTAIALGTATGIAIAQALKFSNGVSSYSLGITGNLTALAGHWVGVRHQHSLGAVSTGGRVWFRAYDLGTAATPLYPAVGSFIAGSDVSSPAVTGTGGSATGGIDLRGTGGVLQLVTKFWVGMPTIQALPFTTYWDETNETPGSLQWVAGPTASAPPSNAGVTVSDSYPAAGASATINVSGVTGATVSRTLSLAAPPADHPTYGQFSGQPAWPDGTTAPTIANATTTTTTTIGPLAAGQTWVRLRSVGSGGTTDSYHPLWTHPVVNTLVNVQDVVSVGWTSEGGASNAEATLNDNLDTTWLESPGTPTAADYNMILWQPWAGGPATPSLKYRRKVDATDTVSGLTWHHILYAEDRTTVLEPETTWANPASEAGVAKDKTITLSTDTQAALSAFSSKRALYSKVWTTIT